MQSGIRGTYYAPTTAGGACQLPSGDYGVTHAIALGQQHQLENLRWRQGMCGQVLDINCGGQSVQAIVADICALGSDTCGIDMILRTWNTLTNNAPPGVTTCNVDLSRTNPLKVNGMQCYHRPNSDIGNEWFVMLGVMNTEGRISARAEVAGVQGTRANDHWFSFSGNGQPLFKNDAVITFFFEDGSSQQFKIGDCHPGDPGQIFQ